MLVDWALPLLLHVYSSAVVLRVVTFDVAEQYFNFTYDDGHKNCYLTLVKDLDRESHDRHTLRIDVDFESKASRKKRQVGLQTNSTVYIFSTFCCWF